MWLRQYKLLITAKVSLIISTAVVEKTELEELLKKEIVVSEMILKCI